MKGKQFRQMYKYMKNDKEGELSKKNLKKLEAPEKKGATNRTIPVKGIRKVKIEAKSKS